MRLIQPENPSHVHIRSLRMRFLLPLFSVGAAALGIGMLMAMALGNAAHRDAESSALLLARTVASAPESAVPYGATAYRMNRRGEVPLDAVQPDARLVTEVLSRKEGAVTLQADDGSERTYGFSKVSDGYLAVGMASETFFGRTRAVLQTWIVVGGALGLLSLWAAAVLGDLLLLRRARRLSEAFRRIASGELDATRDLVHGMGELDDVTEVFEAIAAKLQKAYSSTDENVKKRTVELEFNKSMAELEKARTEALLASVGDGLLVTDGEGKVSFINKEGQRMVGFTADELQMQFANAFLRIENDKGDLIAPDAQPMQVALSSGKKYESPVYPKPYYFVRKDKTRFPAQITVTPIVASGAVAGTIQVFRDITAEVEFDRRKSEFISIASHQLRSPLSATKWLTDMLRKGDAGALAAPQQELVEKLFQANERMIVLVNELLNVSRLESGTVKLSPKETDLAALVDAVATESTPLLLTKQQSFEKSLGAPAKLVMDASLIREVTANLISNASKYSPAGSAIGVSVRIDGPDAVVAVQDHGMGIPQSDQPQMFKKFFRAENATKSDVTGTGLGLYVCKSIIELHGGRIWFDSVPEKGTTFFYSLPLKGATITEGEVHLT